MPAGRFQNPPGIDLGLAAGSQSLQALDFSLDVIGFNIQVDTARVMDPLQA
jgi:hypothetical protein